MSHRSVLGDTLVVIGVTTAAGGLTVKILLALIEGVRKPDFYSLSLGHGPALLISQSASSPAHDGAPSRRDESN